MSIHSERKEIDAIVDRLLDNLSATISSQTGREGIELRHMIGDMRANYIDYLTDSLFSTKLLECFTSARIAKVTLASLVNVRVHLYEESPVGTISNAIVQTAIGFCLAAESRMITEIEFTCRDDVENMIKVMKSAFDTARDLAADAIDSSSYQSLTYLAGSLTNFLATSARPLPRMITFTLATSLPALSLSQRIYYEAGRWEELVAENKVIHPAFCPINVKGLSA